ncbi:hypothetical protein [Streptococcus suis]|uniref:Uncharacterized protein n=1 Tax=Streptococcus suis TaxID=1307 RepID=A0A822W130_STRSU|nr:hypothetical protein [Streptococcus suis]NRH10750.1 hypothetical protein [Streptococcus suis]CZA70807.1 Uncharacterised protein [Streptococcus suis]
MNGYEFMARHPFLTFFLVLTVCHYFSECIKYLAGYTEETNEQTDQEEKS